ncbi:hypothetical protein D3C73_671540 [compost metagenome]
MLVEGVEHGTDADLAGLENIGAAAVGVAHGVIVLAGRIVLHVNDIVLLGPTLVENVGAGQVVGIDQVRRAKLDLDGQVVDSLDLDDIGMQLAKVRLFGAGTVERESHVFRGEVRAVVEFHTLAQREHPSGGIPFLHLPLRGDARRQGALGITPDEAFVDVVQERMCDAVVLRMRVERQRIGRPCPANCRGVRRECGEGKGKYRCG